MSATAAATVTQEHRQDAYETLLQRCKALEPVATAVAYPCERTALAGVVEAAEARLIGMSQVRVEIALMADIVENSGNGIVRESLRAQFAHHGFCDIAAITGVWF